MSREVYCCNVKPLIIVFFVFFSQFFVYLHLKKKNILHILSSNTFTLEEKPSNFKVGYLNLTLGAGCQVNRLLIAAVAMRLQSSSPFLCDVAVSLVT